VKHSGVRHSGVRRIGVEERRARLAVRHRFAPSARAATPVEVAESVVALHSTDPASVFLSVHARAPRVGVEAIERALYEDRSLIRMLGMRRTVFVVPVDLAPVVQASSTKAIALNIRRNYLKYLDAAGVGDEAWLKQVEEATARALAARGEAVGADLAVDVPELRTKVSLNEGKAYGGQQNVTTWVLSLLAADGRIVRGRPRGSWTSSQYRWSPVERWLPTGVPEWPVERARAELARRWLARYGPATVADLRWWTGWTAAAVKQALAAVDPVEVDLDGEPGLVLPDDVEPVRCQPWVALLPALDPTPMGWSQRSWYLGPHGPALFDRSGNVGPTILSDGRIVGGWAQRADGEIVYRLLEDIGADKAREVEQAVARLSTWVGPVRVTPRFRTPLAHELIA
jgi:hypothetical protein